MKIIYIADSIIPSLTANSIHVMKMCQAFKQNRTDITLVIPQYNNEMKVNNVFDFYGIKDEFEIVKILIKNRWGKLISFPYRAVRYAMQQKTNLIYTRDFFTTPYASCFKIPFVFETHQPPESFIRKLYLQLAVRSKYLKYLVVITNSLKNWYVERGISKEKVVVLPDAVDIERFQNPKFFESKPIEKIQIGYAGHLYKGRGIELILKLAEMINEIKFVIIGGRQEDIEFWKDYANKKKMQNVSFVGFVQNNQLPQHLETVDILLMPYNKNVPVAGKRKSTGEFMSPLKMFEYMATGKPIIASDLPVLKEILEHKENCLLVPYDNVAEWLNAIKYILNDTDFAVRISKKARKEVEEKYTWNIRVEKILQMVNS